MSDKHIEIQCKIHKFSKELMEKYGLSRIDMLGCFAAYPILSTGADTANIIERKWMGLNKSMRKRRNYERDYSTGDTSKRRYHQKEECLGRMSGADGDKRNDTSKSKETHKKLWGRTCATNSI